MRKSDPIECLSHSISNEIADSTLVRMMKEKKNIEGQAIGNTS